MSIMLKLPKLEPSFLPRSFFLVITLYHYKAIQHLRGTVVMLGLVLQIVTWISWTILKLVCRKVSHRIAVSFEDFSNPAHYVCTASLVCFSGIKCGGYSSKLIEFVPLVILMGCMVFLLPFIDVIEILMPTLYFLLHKDCGILRLHNVFL